MRRYARSLVGEEYADDLVHEALIRAYERYPTFRAGGNLQHWLLAIVHNCFVDRWRRSQVERAGMESLAKLSSPYAQPSQEHSVELGRLTQAFHALPAEQREVLHLIVVEGLSYQASATILGIPVGTVMSRLSRARTQLRLGPASQRPALKIVGDDHEQSG